MIIRFGMTTPYWPLSLSYGLFYDPVTRIRFGSVDHWLGYHMLVRREDREAIMKTPNGYLAHQRLLDIISNPDNIIPQWEQERDHVLDRGLRLKYAQCIDPLNLLMGTDTRDIIDDSRADESYWCWCKGEGKNRHGTALMRLRDHVRSGGTLEIPQVDIPNIE